MTEIQSYEAIAAERRERAMQNMTPERLTHLNALFQQLESTVVQDALDVGDQAPDFTLREAGTGEEVRLSAAIARGPVVLSFYRGQWCPYCNLEARALQSIHEEIRALGGDIYLVGPETQENALRMREKSESTLPILFDDQAEVVRQFGIAFELPEFYQEAYRAAGNDLPAKNPGAGWTLPVPATYVIAPSGQVVARHLDPNYMLRMEPSEILAAARAAAAPVA